MNSKTNINNSQSGFKYILYKYSNTEHANEKLPLILFLHGADLIGDNLDTMSSMSIGPFGIFNDGKESQLLQPCIIAAPQCTNRMWWDPEKLLILVNELQENYPVDPSRIYGTGASMGSHGIW